MPPAKTPEEETEKFVELNLLANQKLYFYHVFRFLLNLSK